VLILKTEDRDTAAEREEIDLQAVSNKTILSMTALESSRKIRPGVSFA